MLPGMLILVSVLLLVDEISPARLLSGSFGVASIVVNHRAGRVVEPWQVFALLPAAVGLAFAGFWVSGLG